MVARCVVALAACLALLPPASAGAQTPLGMFEGTFGRFDRDTLAPIAPNLPLPEPHARPIYSPDRKRLALGLSKASGAGRIGVWIVDPARVEVLHEVQTGIAAEAVVFPGVVAALLQDGRLVVVDPDTGRIRGTRRVAYTSCAPEAVQAAGRGVIVNAVRRARVEVTVVDPGGALHALELPLRSTAVNCRKAGLAADDHRVYVSGANGVAEIDPVTRRVRLHRSGGGTDAAVVPGGLAVAGASGLRMLDTRTWRTRWRDRGARTVFASGSTLVTGDAKARDARSGRLLWRGSGRVLAVAAGRVYTEDATLDLENGERVGTHAPILTGLRFAR